MMPLFPVFLKVVSCTPSLAQSVPLGCFSPAGGVLRSQESPHLLSLPGAAALGQDPLVHFCSVPQLQARLRRTTEIIKCLGISRAKIRISSEKQQPKKVYNSYLYGLICLKLPQNCYTTVLYSHITFIYLFMS